MDNIAEDLSLTIVSHVDWVTRSGLALWAWCPAKPDEVITVDVFINNSHVGRFEANQMRNDLEASGIGTGRYGLTQDLKHYTSAYPVDAPLDISIFAVTPVRQLIGSVRISDMGFDADALDASKVEKMRALFDPLIPVLTRDMALRGPSMPPVMDPAFDRILLPAVLDPSLAGGPSTIGPLISKYSDFTRYRMRVDKIYQVDMGRPEIENYYKWYLEFYSRNRGNSRAPLSSYEIDYLNELIIVGGRTYHLSRATYIFLHSKPDLLARMDLNSFSYYYDVVYWWSIEASRSLFVEDCLIPTSYQAVLSAVGSQWQKLAFPPSSFVESYFSRQVSWHFLDLLQSTDRVLVYLAFFLSARTDPFLLAYLPRKWLYEFTTSKQGNPSVFLQACDAIFGSSAAALHDYSCEQILQACGFDLAASRSLSISPNRHRLMSAALPRPLPATDPHHVQIIGPMESTSGLGQAARLSANSLGKTAFSQSSYSFTLDNPAPVGFANEVLVSNLVYPAVNLIHLNAESIPLAFAYMPDVFSGAYNIGYFFWELDSPAKCHSLALELLDEIWVSSQYGVDIYAPHTSKPVINVGMSFEKVPVVDRGTARQFLERRVGVKPNEFVFLAAFDSYSFIQRKNPQAVVRAFKAAFNQGEPVRLILKTHNKDFVCDPVQIRIWQALNEEIQADHRIILMNETLQYDDLIKLKGGCDAYVSLHRSEGWGFGIVEAMNLGVPVIATGYSGNLEFCNEQTSFLVDYDLKALDYDDYIFVVPGQRWAEPRHASAVAQLRSVFHDSELRQRRAAAGQVTVQESFSPEAVGKRYAKRIEEILELRLGGLKLTAAPAAGTQKRLKRRPSPPA